MQARMVECTGYGNGVSIYLVLSNIFQTSCEDSLHKTARLITAVEITWILPFSAILVRAILGHVAKHGRLAIDDGPQKRDNWQF